MSVVIFLGPTLARQEAESLLPATYLPPVSQGDIYAVTRDRPWGIGIVDGYFDRVPSVWHKEILWALSQGIHVFGSSSMGALRAVELETFGMVGVGTVYEAFRSGELTDDDEVAIVHGPTEVGYLAGSEALVNMRATFRAAASAGCFSESLGRQLVVIAKTLHYPSRTYEKVLEIAASRKLAPADLDRLRAWLPNGRIDVKGDDARDLLRHIAATQASAPGPVQGTFPFHTTVMWKQLRNVVDRRAGRSLAGAMDALEDGLLEELRLNPTQYQHERERACARMLAVEIARMQGDRVSEATLRAMEGSSGEVPDDGPPVSKAGRLVEQGVPPERVRLLLEDEALADGVRSRYERNLPMYLGDHLRVVGRFKRLNQRAVEKGATLARWGLQNPVLSDAEISEEALWQWYFAEVCAQDVPADLDAFARSLDVASADHLVRIVLREWLFRKKSGEGGEGGGAESIAPSRSAPAVAEEDHART